MTRGTEQGRGSRPGRPCPCGSPGAAAPGLPFPCGANIRVVAHSTTRACAGSVRPIGRTVGNSGAQPGHEG